MSKNKYTQTFSAFNPSDEAVERIFEMTADKKKTRINYPIKRIAAAAFAFVLVIGGGFGVNSFVKKNDESSDRLSVLVAYAGEQELLEAGSVNEQELFYRIYVADIDDKEQCNSVKTEWGNEKADQLEKASKLGKNNITASVGSGSGGCYSSEQDRDTAIMYTLRAGNFVLTLNDYSNVKDIVIENSSEYGETVLQFEAESGDLFDSVRCGHSVSITGEELEFSVDSGFYETYTGNGTVNKGYSVQWEVSDCLYNTVGNDVDFDLSQIKDTITFTVNYNDGTSEQASVSLSLDSDGYMHIDGTE